MPRTLFHLHRVTQDAQDASGANQLVTKRVFLRATISHPFYSSKRSKPFEALIDTGASVSVVPAAALAKAGITHKRAPIDSLHLADGTKLDSVPTYSVRLDFTAHSPDGKQREPKFFQFPPEGEEVLCCALNTEQMIIGWDILRHWRLVLDEQANEFKVGVNDRLRS